MLIGQLKAFKHACICFFIVCTENVCSDTSYQTKLYWFEKSDLKIIILNTNLKAFFIY